MTRQMLSLHWKAARWGLLPWVVVAFGFPFMVVSRLQPEHVDGSQALWQPLLSLGSLLPLVAAAAGATVALTAWSWDHRQGHVYALALPVTRSRYASTKFLVGLLLAAIPAVALAGGGMLAAATVELPDLVRAYPAALALKFYLASITAYGVLFALAAGTMRTAVIVLSAAVGTIFFGDPLLQLTAGVIPSLEGILMSDLLVDAMTRPWSPFQVFFGNWFLFDV